MKKIIILISLIFIYSSLFSASKTRVAVLPFENLAGITSEEAKYLTDRVRTELIKTKRFEIVSNDQLNTMMKTKKLKQLIGEGTCRTDSCVIDLGNALECEKMVVGSISKAFKEYSINGKILDVVRQKYEGAEEVVIKNKDNFPGAATELVHRLLGGMPRKYVRSKSNIQTDPAGQELSLYSTMIWQTLFLPGWGHITGNQTRGWYYASAWLLAGTLFFVSHFTYTSYKNDYTTAKADFNSKYNTANTWHQVRGITSWALIGLYVLVNLDIIIFGGNYKSTQFLNSSLYSDQKKTAREIQFTLYQRYSYHHNI
jgi:TolB-like protein